MRTIYHRLRNVAGHAIAWAICLMLALAAGEAAGAILFYLQQHSSIVYTNKRATAPEAPSPQTSEWQSPKQYSQRLHPYLGFTGPYDLVSPTWRTNNLGFPQETNLKVPFATTPRDLAVFVFGGSVASNLVVPPQGG